MKKELKELYNKAIEENKFCYDDLEDLDLPYEEVEDFEMKLSDRGFHIGDKDEDNCVYTDEYVPQVEDDEDDDELSDEYPEDTEDIEEDLDEELDNIDDSQFYDNLDDAKFDAALLESESSNIDIDIKVDDSVKMLRKQMGNIKLLTKDKEKEIAKTIWDVAKEKEAFEKKRMEGYIPTREEEAAMNARIQEGEKAKHILAESNIKLVFFVAKYYGSSIVNSSLEFGDLISEGSLGLMKAVEKFDYTKGYAFSTYATGWIRQAITRAIADYGRTIRIPVHVQEKNNRINKTERELTSKLGRKPTIDELAEAMGETVEKIQGIKNVPQSTKSLEDKVGDDEESTLGDFLSDQDHLTPEEYTELEAKRKEIAALLSTLSDREERIIKLRYGLIDGRVRTLEEIAKEFDVTKERIRQIENKSLRKLKHPTKKNKVSDFSVK